MGIYYYSRVKIYRVFFRSSIFPASEYLFSAPRGLKKSIISTRFCSLSSRYLEYLRSASRTLSRVPASRVKSTIILGYLEYLLGNWQNDASNRQKNNVTRQYPTFMSSVVNKVSLIKWITGNSLTHFLSMRPSWGFKNI